MEYRRSLDENVVPHLFFLQDQNVKQSYIRDFFMYIYIFLDVS